MIVIMKFTMIKANKKFIKGNKKIIFEKFLKNFI